MNQLTTSIALTCLLSPIIGILLGCALSWSKRDSLQIFGQMVATWSLIGWGAIGGISLYESGLLKVDVPANVFCTELGPLTLTWLMASSFFWIASFSQPQKMSLGTLTHQLLTFGFVQLAIVTTHCGIQWSLIAAVSWLTLSRISLPTGKTTHPANAGIIVADFIWLTALLTITSVIRSMTIEDLCQVETLVSLGPTQSTFLITGVYGLIFSLALRCALFPMSSLVHGSAPALASFSSVGLGGLLLLRYQPLLTAFSETRSMMIGLGVLSVVLLPVIGLVESNRQLKIFRVATATLALMWLGIGSAPQRLDSVVKLGVCTLIVSGLGIAQLRRPSQWFLLTLFACGVCGQEWCLGAVRYATTHAENIHVPKAFVAIVLLGHALNCYLLFTISQDENNRQPRQLLPVAGIALMLLSQGLAAWGWQRTWSLQLGTLAVVSLLTAIVCVTYHNPLANMLSRRGKSIVRLSETQFYASSLFWIFTVPIHIMSYCMLAMSMSLQFLIAQLRSMTRLTAMLAARMDDESDHSFAIVSMTILTLSIGWAVSAWL